MLGHRQVTEAAVDHESGGLVGRIRGLDGLWMPRHAVLDNGALVPIGGDSQEDVPFRQDPDETFAVENDRGADSAFHHSASRLAEAKPALDREHASGHHVSQDRNARMLLGGGVAYPERSPGIQSVPASGTPAIAAASTVSATRSSGSRLCTCDLPHARASVCASSVRTRR